MQSKKTLKELLIELDACNEAREWANEKTIEEVVNDCHRGDWLLWLSKKVDMDIQPLTLAKGHCAATVVDLMRDERSKKAVQKAIDFGNGICSRIELDAAAYAAANAADAAAANAAAYAAAYAADNAAANAAANAANAAYAAANAAAYAAANAAAYAAANAAAYAAAYAAANAADAAGRKQNQQLTADICRKYIGDLLVELVNKKLTYETK